MHSLVVISPVTIRYDYSLRASFLIVISTTPVNLWRIANRLTARLADQPDFPPVWRMIIVSWFASQELMTQGIIHDDGHIYTANCRHKIWIYLIATHLRDKRTVFRPDFVLDYHAIIVLWYCMIIYFFISYLYKKVWTHRFQQFKCNHRWDLRIASQLVSNNWSENTSSAENRLLLYHTESFNSPVRF